MLRLENVSFTYPKSDVPILKDISFTVEDGSFVSMIGASGTGKTTIFRLLNALETPSGGEILVDGRRVCGESHLAGYMPQQDLLFPWRTALQNVMLPMQISHEDKEKSKRTALEMLERVGLGEYTDKYPRELSGGMRQRVSFARTLCTGASLLLLDEPFSALDSITRASMQEWLIEQWQTLDKTILFITHDVDEAIFLSEKILVLSGKPVDTIKAYEVPLPKNRDRDMMTAPDIERLKQELIAILKSEAEAI